MQGLKHAVLVIFVVAVISMVVSFSDRRRGQIPRSTRDRIRYTIKATSQDVLSVHSNQSQNPVIVLLRLHSDLAVLENLRSIYTDQELNEISQIDISALVHVVQTEQHKAFQRVSYFLPSQLGQDAYMQNYWPQSVYPSANEAIPQTPTPSEVSEEFKS